MRIIDDTDHVSYDFKLTSIMYIIGFLDGLNKEIIIFM